MGFFLFIVFYFLKITFHFTYQTQVSLPSLPTLTSLLSIPHPLLRGVRLSLGSQQGPAYPLVAVPSPSSSVKAEQRMQPEGMSSKKSVHAPGRGPDVTARPTDQAI